MNKINFVKGLLHGAQNDNNGHIYEEYGFPILSMNKSNIVDSSSGIKPHSWQ